MCRINDVQSAHGFRNFWIVLGVLVNHVQLDGQLSVRVSDDRERKLADNVQTVRLDVLIITGRATAK